MEVYVNKNAPYRHFRGKFGHLDWQKGCTSNHYRRLTNWDVLSVCLPLVLHVSFLVILCVPALVRFFLRAFGAVWNFWGKCTYKSMIVLLLRHANATWTLICTKLAAVRKTTATCKGRLPTIYKPQTSHSDPPKCHFQVQPIISWNTDWFTMPWCPVFFTSFFGCQDSL